MFQNVLFPKGKTRGYHAFLNSPLKSYGYVFPSQFSNILIIQGVMKIRSSLRGSNVRMRIKDDLSFGYRKFWVNILPVSSVGIR
jgi:hypothetical protein